MRVLLCILATLPLMVLAKDGETEVKEVKCWNNDYRCYNYGYCIPNYKVCDGYEDCPYGDDEDNCYHTTTEDYGCPDNYYECEYDGKCIPNSWLCDNYKDCPVYGDDEYPDNCNLGFTTTTTTTTFSPVLTTHHQRNCDEPFEIIDGRCIFVDPFTKTAWSEARYFCQKFNSDLVILDDMHFYSNLLQYLHKAGIESNDYWVGARDLDEGKWRWVDNTTVHVGAPLWALYGCSSDYNLEPNPSYASNQDCGFLDYSAGLYMNDAECDENYSAICQRSTFGKESDAKEA